LRKDLSSSFPIHRFPEGVIIMKLATQAEALFVSSLQPSDRPTLDQVVAAIGLSLQTRGVSGCADVLATEYGAHPEEAAHRMRWALSLMVGCSPAMAS
jgi:hypothetical protein